MTQASYLSKEDIEASIPRRGDPLLTKDEIEEIKFLARQGPGKVNRVRLVCNLFKIDKETLYTVLELT